MGRSTNAKRDWFLADIREMVNCCIVLHNMTTEVRQDAYNFTEVVDFDDEEVEGEHEVESIFLEEGNQVGEETGELLVARTGGAFEHHPGGHSETCGVGGVLECPCEEAPIT